MAGTSIMQSAEFMFIIEQLQSATSVSPSLTQTRACWGMWDLFGPGVGRDCHSQWPAARSPAWARLEVARVAATAAIVKSVFMTNFPD